MRLDGQRTYGTDDVVDVVVVGTGAGGAHRFSPRWPAVA